MEDYTYFRHCPTKDIEILSLCTSGKEYRKVLDNLITLRDISLVIIHYSSYSSAKIQLFVLPWAIGRRASSMVLMKTYLKEETLSIIVPTLTNRTEKAYLHSSIFNLRKIQYINISLGNKDTLSLIKFDINTCTTVTVFYHPHLSNIRGRQSSEETVHNYKTIYYKHDFIQSVLLNISACTFIAPPCFTLEITTTDTCYAPNLINEINSTHYYLLPIVVFDMYHIYKDVYMKTQIVEHPVWVMVHMIKPQDVPSNAIWRVWIETCRVSHVSFEFIVDDYQSSSVYEWNYLMYGMDRMDQWNYLRNTDGGFYMVVDKVVNILFVSNHWYTHEICKDFFSVWFVRHFIHDDKTANIVAGQTLQHSYFTFHNQR